MPWSPLKVGRLILTEHRRTTADDQVNATTGARSVRLSGQEYVDIYAATMKNRLAAAKKAKEETAAPVAPDRVAAPGGRPVPAVEVPEPTEEEIREGLEVLEAARAEAARADAERADAERAEASQAGTPARGGESAAEGEAAEERGSGQ